MQIDNNDSVLAYYWCHSIPTLYTFIPLSNVNEFYGNQNYASVHPLNVRECKFRFLNFTVPEVKFYSFRVVYSDHSFSKGAH